MTLKHVCSSICHLGITSLLSSSSANVASDSSSTGKITPPAPASSTSATVLSQSSSLSFGAPVPSSSSSFVQPSPQAPLQTSNKASALVQALHRDMDLTTEAEPSYSSTSLESKIHSFLQGNPAFSAFDVGFSTNPSQGGDHFSPVTGTDTQDGTPVRDEGGGTPTQDEIMDKPVVVPFTSNINQPSVGETAKSARMAFENNSHQKPINPQHQSHLQPGKTQNGQVYQPYPYGKQEISKHGITPPVANYQQISVQTGVGLSGERAPGTASSIQTAEGFQGANERNWYGGGYPEGAPQQSSGYNVRGSGGIRENKTLEPYAYQAEQTLKPKEFISQQGPTAASAFFRGTLPPVPKLPPPPPPPAAFEIPLSSSNSKIFLPDQQPVPNTDTGRLTGARRDSVIGGMVVQDHQHKPLLHPQEPPYNIDPHEPRHPEGIPPHSDNLHNQENFEGYHNDPGQNATHLFHDDPHYPPDDSYYRPGSPPHPYPRVRGRLTPPPSPSREPYFAHGYQQHTSSPLQYTPRHPPRHPPPHEIRHPGLRPPHRPPHPPPHLRGPPRLPFHRFHGPDPRLRGKRPGPRGGGPMFPLKRPFPPPRY